MGKEFIAVRDVDERIYRKFKIKAMEEKMKVGVALTIAMKEWLEEQRNIKKKDIRNLFLDELIDFGPGSERDSERIDEIIYGTSKEWRDDIS